MSHQGADRPDVKNSVVLEPPLRIKSSAGTKQMAIETRTIDQSKAFGFTG
jgi:hypothetical protein